MDDRVPTLPLVENHGSEAGIETSFEDDRMDGRNGVQKLVKEEELDAVKDDGISEIIGMYRQPSAT